VSELLILMGRVFEPFQLVFALHLINRLTSEAANHIFSHAKDRVFRVVPWSPNCSWAQICAGEFSR
jgi:hypothetical protein